MAVKNITWQKIEPGQIVNFLYKSNDETRAVKRVVLCINPELRYKKKNGRTTKFFIGIQLNTQGEREITSSQLKKIIYKLGGLENDEGSLEASISENISKTETKQLIKILGGFTDRYRTFNLRKCKTKRVFLETNYKQLPKDEIKRLEVMADINED